MIAIPRSATGIAVPLSRPDITDFERRAVMRVLESPVLSIGPELERFESMLAESAGVSHAVAVNSGTSALHMAALALGIGPGDEVITTSFSFIASANCILFTGATPVFADIDPLTLCIDPDDIERRITERTKAVLAVDVFGHPADWERLEAIAERHGLRLIEDSAESIGSVYKGRSAGSFGDAAVFAFYPNKQMTTGEGGALLTDSDDVADMARSLRNQGRANGAGWLTHARLGFNYRMSELGAALGVAQLQRLSELISDRSRVAARYNDLLAEMPEIQTQRISPGIEMSWFVYVVRLAAGYTRQQRDALLSMLRERGIGCSNYFPCIHLEPVYRERSGYGPGDFPVAEDISDRCVALPFFGRMTDEQQFRVVGELKEAVTRL